MTSNAHTGLMPRTSGGSGYNADQLQIDAALMRARIAIPVEVVAVHGGGVGAPPTVDVLPLVQQIDGKGNRVPHTTVFGIPCARNQGGGNAIVNDPVKGDLGLLVVCDRDISSVKASAKASVPGSRRRNSVADGIYVAAIINPAAPSQAVVFTSTGIMIFDTNGNRIVMGPTGIAITGNVTITGNLDVTGEVTADSAGSSVGLATHTHGGITAGAANTLKPNGGT